MNSITTLLVCGVTTEVCVHTTIREANDRGYHCIAIEDCCASFFDHFHKTAIEMITAQNGIFGSVTTSKDVVNALQQKQEEEEKKNAALAAEAAAVAAAAATAAAETVPETAFVADDDIAIATNTASETETVVEYNENDDDLPTTAEEVPVTNSSETIPKLDMGEEKKEDESSPSMPADSTAEKPITENADAPTTTTTPATDETTAMPVTDSFVIESCEV